MKDYETNTRALTNTIYDTVRVSAEQWFGVRADASDEWFTL